MKFMNALIIFLKMINHVLYNYLNDFCVIYLDNILIFSKILKKHKKHIDKILQKLQEKKINY